jgi:hypothetical protein
VGHDGLQEFAHELALLADVAGRGQEHSQLVDRFDHERRTILSDNTLRLRIGSRQASARLSRD